MATVSLYNASGNSGGGGACNCDDAHVQGPGGKTSLFTLLAGQRCSWNLSQLGWDTYEGEGFEVAAICSGSSNWRHSKTFIYQKDETYEFQWHGPSTNPSIAGPT